MRTGPKALVGLGLPAALRPHTPDKGVGVIFDYTVITPDRMIGPNTRFIDTRLQR